MVGPYMGAVHARARRFNYFVAARSWTQRHRRNHPNDLRSGDRWRVPRECPKDLGPADREIGGIRRPTRVSSCARRHLERNQNVQTRLPTSAERPGNLKVADAFRKHYGPTTNAFEAAETIEPLLKVTENVLVSQRN